LRMETDSVQWLHRSLTQREAPETVAGRILRVLPDARKPTLALATKISRASQAARVGWSSMSTEFRGVDPMDVQIGKARELALAFVKTDLPDAHDIAELYAFIDGFNALIGKGRGGSSFRYNRLNRTDRAGIGLTISRRRYDKLFRLSGRLEDRLKRLQRATKRYALLLVGKAGLVADIKIDDLAGRPWTASFIAYYSARMKLRSEFTISGQQNPFDQLSAALLEGCGAEGNANWFAIAHVFPREDVLARLSDVQKGSLMGRWYVVLLHTAAMLQEAYERSSINLDTMIVKKGDDSSTWNTFAGAWNRARDNWIALVSALGMERMFDVMLPGKVMRLMAADVAAWHRRWCGANCPSPGWFSPARRSAHAERSSLPARAMAYRATQPAGRRPGSGARWRSSAPRPNLFTGCRSRIPISRSCCGRSACSRARSSSSSIFRRSSIRLTPRLERTV
jgi:hypothetical protein